MNETKTLPRYFVQSTRVRGEPRVYWVIDRRNSNFWRQSIVKSYGTNKRGAEKKVVELNAVGQSTKSEELK